MENCCKNSFTFCTPFIGCPKSVIVAIPASYTDEFITLRFFKGDAVGAEIEAEVINGFATVTADQFPTAFFNPFAGSYFGQYVDENTGQAITWANMAGMSFDSFIFTLTPGTTTTTGITLNPL